MKTRYLKLSQLGVLLGVLLAPAAVAGPSCQSNDLRADIACLKRLGISIDRFTAEYLEWVSDLRQKLKELNAESARCAVLRLRYEENGDLALLKDIDQHCQGDWLEDRTGRFNQIRQQYETTKARYERIRELYDVAKELLAVIEGRQADLEREYAERMRNR